GVRDLEGGVNAIKLAVFVRLGIRDIFSGSHVPELKLALFIGRFHVARYLERVSVAILGERAVSNHRAGKWLASRRVDQSPADFVSRRRQAEAYVDAGQLAAFFDLDDRRAVSVGDAGIVSLFTRPAFDAVS